MYKVYIFYGLWLIVLKYLCFKSSTFKILKLPTFIITNLNLFTLSFEFQKCIITVFFKL